MFRTKCRQLGYKKFNQKNNSQEKVKVQDLDKLLCFIWKINTLSTTPCNLLKQTCKSPWKDYLFHKEIKFIKFEETLVLSYFSQSKGHAYLKKPAEAAAGFTKYWWT